MAKARRSESAVALDEGKFFYGSDGNDSLTGTSGGDTFIPYTGVDRVSGGAGDDFLLLNYDSVASGNYSSAIKLDGNAVGFAGVIRGGSSSCTMDGIDTIATALTNGSDILTVTLASNT